MRLFATNCGRRVSLSSTQLLWVLRKISVHPSKQHVDYLQHALDEMANKDGWTVSQAGSAQVRTVRYPLHILEREIKARRSTTTTNLRGHRHLKSTT